MKGGADVLHTGVWVSMKKEAESATGSRH